MAVLSFETSSPDCLLNSSSKNLWTIPSTSSPPQAVSPLVALTSMTPWLISKMEISKVPPPRSQTAMVLSSFFSIPKAMAAAVGSLMILQTLRPAIWPASLVAWRWESLKQAGTVMTARSTVLPRQLSAVSFIFMSTKAPTWDGEQLLPWTSTQASPLECLMILKGMFFLSFWTAGSSYLLPIIRFVANTVFSELVMAWRLAGAPTSFSPSLVNATTDGVVLFPSAFSMTLGVLPSISATHEFVVPRSIPMMGPLPPELNPCSSLLFTKRSIQRTVNCVNQIQLQLYFYPHLFYPLYLCSNPHPQASSPSRTMLKLGFGREGQSGKVCFAGWEAQ